MHQKGVNASRSKELLYYVQNQKYLKLKRESYCKI